MKNYRKRVEYVPNKAIGGILLNTGIGLATTAYQMYENNKEEQELKGIRNRTNAYNDSVNSATQLNDFNSNLGRAGFYANGGVAASGSNTELNKLASNIKEVDANIPGRDTVPLVENGEVKAMVDDKEVIVNIGDGKQLIFSDDLGFASAAKNLSLTRGDIEQKMLKFEGRETANMPSNNVIRRYKDKLKEIDANLMNLFLEQEQVKAQSVPSNTEVPTGNNPQAIPEMAYGGAAYIPSLVGAGTSAIGTLTQKGPIAPTRQAFYARNARFNADDQLAAIKDFESASVRDVNAKVNSGVASAALANTARATGLRETNKVLTNKENIETQISNENTKDKQRIDNTNAARYDNYIQAKLDFNNQKLANTASNLNVSMSNIETINKDKAKFEQQNDFMDRQENLEKEKLAILKTRYGDVESNELIERGLKREYDKSLPPITSLLDERSRIEDNNLEPNIEETEKVSKDYIKSSIKDLEARVENLKYKVDKTPEDIREEEILLKTIKKFNKEIEKGRYE